MRSTASRCGRALRRRGLRVVAVQSEEARLALPLAVVAAEGAEAGRALAGVVAADAVGWCVDRRRLHLEHADCTGHVVPGARPCALGTFSYLVTSTSYFCLSYPNRLL